MTETELLKAAIEQLERDPETERLKKLLLCLCRQRWENDADRLNTVDWQLLLDELRESFPGRTQLRDSLIGVVARINKKSLYFPLAARAIAILNVLYPSSSRTSLVEDCFLPQATSKPRTPPSDRWFDLRLMLSRSGNLSQAKMLLYSAIYGKFAYTLQDWNRLNHEEFDTLARSLLETCPTVSELAFRLYGAATCLEPSENYAPIARLLCRAMEQFYRSLPAFDVTSRSGLALDDATAAFSGAPPSTGFDLSDDDRGDRNDVGTFDPPDLKANDLETDPTADNVNATVAEDAIRSSDSSSDWNDPSGDRTEIGIGRDIEVVVNEAAYRHAQTAAAAIEQHARALTAEVRALVAHVDVATAAAIEGRVLSEFAVTVQKLSGNFLAEERANGDASPPPMSDSRNDNRGDNRGDTDL